MIIGWTGARGDIGRKPRAVISRAPDRRKRNSQDSEMGECTMDNLYKKDGLFVLGRSTSQAQRLEEQVRGFGLFAKRAQNLESIKNWGCRVGSGLG